MRTVFGLLAFDAEQSQDLLRLTAKSELARREKPHKPLEQATDLTSQNLCHRAHPVASQDFSYPSCDPENESERLEKSSGNTPRLGELNQSGSGKQQSWIF